eukprot:66304-Rhodomonas_salina.2
MVDFNWPGPQYTVDEISGKLGVELHDPTFNAISDLDDSVHNWADTVNTLASSRKRCASCRAA